MGRGRIFILLLIDISVIIAAYFLTLAIRSSSNLYFFKATLRYSLPFETWMVFALLVPAFIFLSYIFGNYDDKLGQSWVGLGVRIFIVNVLLLSFALIVQYALNISLTRVPRSIIVTFLAFNGLMSLMARSLYKVIRLMGRPTRLLLVCDGNTPPYLLEELKKFNDFRIKVVGIVTPTKVKKAFPGYQILGFLRDINTFIDKHRAEMIIIAIRDIEAKTRVLRSIDQQHYMKLRILVLPSPYEIIISEPDYFRVRDIPLIKINKSVGNVFMLKRILDFAFAFMSVLILSPVFGVLWIVIRLTSPGPAIYSQRRVGLHEKPFVVHKFRTMYAEHGNKIRKVAPGPDKRITTVGRVLRQLRLDELPQLINVLKGDMSFIGPRPFPEHEVVEYKAKIPLFHERSTVVPGLTGLAQVHGDYHTDIEQKFNYDLWYIYNYTLLLDVRIFFETVKTVVMRKGT